MKTVVVAGSENSFSFAVIDFTNAANPTITQVDPQFPGGSRVNIAGSNAVAGSVLSGKVRMVDVSNPAAPVALGTVDTQLGGIGAIAIRGNRVAVGEWQNLFQARVTLIDSSAPANPVVLATAATPFASTPSPDPMNPGPAAITSIAFANDNVVVAASASDFEIVFVDFSNLGNPAVSTFNPVIAGPPQIDDDANAGQLVGGDSTSGIVKLFNSNTKALVQNLNTMAASVNSIALSGSRALVGSQNQFPAVLIKFGNNPPFVSFDPGLNGGGQTAINGTLGACADVGGKVKLFDVTPNPPNAPTLLGTANWNAAVSTLAISQFTPPAGPAVVLSAASLVFGSVLVNSSRQMILTIQNTGGATLNVTNIQSSSPHFTFIPTGPIAIPANGSSALTVKFQPDAEAAFNGNLTFNTNDPNHLNEVVPMSGTGALSHISLSTGNLTLGSVPICLSGTQQLTIQNTGGVDLHVSSITTSGPPFSAAPGSAVISPGGSKSVTVAFTPFALGAVNGSLTLVSDDANNPNKSIPLSGTGLPTPPPKITVSPANLNFGATPVQFYIALRVAVANTNPCLDLQVTLQTSGTPFYVTDVDPTTLPPTTQTVNGTVAGNSSKKFVVVFAPTATGAAAEQPGT